MQSVNPISKIRKSTGAGSGKKKVVNRRREFVVCEKQVFPRMQDVRKPMVNFSE